MEPIKELDLNGIDFEICSSQQFATVVYSRGEDQDIRLITVFKDGKIKQFEGHNEYNPSRRRHSTCEYIREEWGDGKVIKICVIQHKGCTLVEVHEVSDEECMYLFGQKRKDVLF